MKQITKYEANDGSQWDAIDKAVERDTLLLVIAETDRLLKPRPEGSFEGYVQQDKQNVMDYKRVLMRIAKKYCYGGSDSSIWDLPVEQLHPSSIAGRFIDDSDCNPLQGAWYRLRCTDDKYREFNQPFYVLNPDKAVMKEINNV